MFMSQFYSKLSMLTQNSYILLLLSLLLPFSTSLSIPMNSACEVSGMQVGTVAFSTANTYNNASVSSILQTITVTLKTAQTATNYRATSVFRSIDYQLTSSSYNIRMWMGNKFTATMEIILTAQPGYRVSNIELRYIIIPTSIPVIRMRQIGYVTSPGTINLAPQESFTYDVTGMPPYTLDNSSEVIVFYRGAQLMFQVDRFNAIGISIDVTLTSNTALSTLFTNIGAYSINVSKIYYTVLWYSKNQIAASIKTFEIIKGQLNTSIHQLQSNDLIIENTFFGFTSFISFNYDFFKINFQITNNSLSAINYYNYSDFKMVYFTFSTGNKHPVCCFKAPFYDGSSLCYDTCPLSYYPTIAYLCTKCTALDCLACDSATVCTKCGLGTLVGGLCTQVSGCTSVNASLASLTNNCAECDIGFLWDSLNNNCSCPLGSRSVTGLCTDIEGCVTAFRRGNQTLCRFCDNSNKFQLTMESCSCVDGYALNSLTLKCEEVCGDGLVFAHSCDDGNTFSGDGCSAKCTVENFYYCYNGSRSHASNCVYSRFDLRLTVVAIGKTIGKNQGRFEFAFVPALTLFNFRKVVKSLNFSSTPNATALEWKEQNGRIIALVTYVEDLEGNAAVVTIELSPIFLLQHSLSLTFQMVSQDLKLIVFRSGSKKDILEAAFQVISFIVLVVFVAASLVYQVTGVELLHTLQIIYFVGTLLPTKTEPVLVFASLANLNLNIKYSINSFNNYYCIDCYGSFSQYNEILSKLILLTITIFPMLLFALRSVLKQYMMKKTWIAIIYAKLYSSVLFPFTIGFLFMGGMAAALPSSDFTLAVLSFCLIIFSSTVFFYECFMYHKERKTLKGDKTVLAKPYIPLYLIFAYVLFTVINAANFGVISHVLIVLLMVLAPFLAWFAFTMPYESAFHNFSQIFNLFLANSFVLWSVVRETSSSALQQENELFYVFLFILMMVLAILFTMIRTVVQVKGRLNLAVKGQTKQQRSMVQIQTLGKEKSKGKSINKLHEYNTYLRDFVTRDKYNHPTKELYRGIAKKKGSNIYKKNKLICQKYNKDSPQLTTSFRQNFQKAYENNATLN